MFKEYLIKKGLDAALEIAKKVLKESKSELTTTRDDIEESINHHLRSVSNWSGEISFNDLKRAKRTTDIFIELDLYVYPRKLRFDPDKEVESIPLREIFDYTSKHIVLLGQPGAGKTTSMKYLCQTLFHQDIHADRFSFPILIKLRDLNNVKIPNDSSIIFSQIYNILGLNIELPNVLLSGKASGERKYLKEKLVINMLEELTALLILDGFADVWTH